MRKKETQKIGDILTEFRNSSPISAKLKEAQVIELWGKMLGPMVANSTTKISIGNRSLFVHIESAVVRHELFMMRTSIVNGLNKELGSNVIDNIIFR